jgi:hypothetical protein
MEFMTSKPALPKILKGIVNTEMKEKVNIKFAWERIGE